MRREILALIQAAVAAAGGAVLATIQVRSRADRGLKHRMAAVVSRAVEHRRVGAAAAQPAWVEMQLPVWVGTAETARHIGIARVHRLLMPEVVAAVPVTLELRAAPEAPEEAGMAVLARLAMTQQTEQQAQAAAAAGIIRMRTTQQAAGTAAQVLF